MKTYGACETHHGVLIKLSGIGLFIIGEPGIGKSNFALELLSYGHQLIADDIVEFYCDDNNKITGHCPDMLDGLLHSRELGFLNITELFSAKAWNKTSIVDYVIELKQPSEHNINLSTKSQDYIICQHAIPKLTLNPQSTISLYTRLKIWLKTQEKPNEAYDILTQRQQKMMK